MASLDLINIPASAAQVLRSRGYIARDLLRGLIPRALRRRLPAEVPALAFSLLHTVTKWLCDSSPSSAVGGASVHLAAMPLWVGRRTESTDGGN